MIILEESEALKKQCWRLEGRCIGSSCMAWVQQVNNKLNKDANVINEDSNTKGFCVALKND
jgi:hypothetical protein